MGILNKILSKEEEAQAKKKATEKKAEVKSAPKKAATPKSTDVKEKKAAPKAAPKKAADKASKKDDERAYKVISFPLITEKATDLVQLNKYVFVVPKDVNKNEVAKAIRNIYGVKPVQVNIIKKSGKKVRYGRRFGKTKDFKKAIVTLRPEDKIEVYEGV